MTATPSEPLDGASILAALSMETRRRVSRLDVALSIDSTNTALMQRPAPDAGAAEVLLAEAQTAGRGRRGRAWLAEPGGTLCLSLSWAFPQLPAEVTALSLAMGVCVLRALAAQGVKNTQLKWPNDILLQGAKLGGILIELRAEPRGRASVVIGIGLNTAIGRDLADRIAELGMPAADLRAAGHFPISRNALAASLIEACIPGLQSFERATLQPFFEEWRRADALFGRRVAVQSESGTLEGSARGVDLSGALILETAQGLQKCVSGDVSVRPMP